LARTLTQPVMVTALFVGLPFLLYFSAAYDLSVRYHWAHLVMDLVFLAVGWLFTWTVLGPDPTPVPAPSLMRLGLLLVAMPFDIVFAAAILATDHVIGNGSASANLYQALALPWVPSLLADQRLGAYLALLTSELVMFLMLTIVVARWRPATPDHDYRQMIEALVRHREPSEPAKVRHY
jgi:putative copper resistance protein D